MSQIHNFEQSRCRDLEKYCERLEYKVKLLESERDYFEELLEKKEKNIEIIQNQLQALQKKIEHQNRTWMQMSEENKRLKKPTFQPSVKDKTNLNFHLESLLNKLYKVNPKSFQQQPILEKFTENNYFECLKSVVSMFLDYIEESTERSFSYAPSPKVQLSIEKAFSPIFQNCSDDDEEIDKLIDESKSLMRTLELQNLKLENLNGKITKQARTNSYH